MISSPDRYLPTTGAETTASPRGGGAVSRLPHLRSRLTPVALAGAAILVFILTAYGLSNVVEGVSAPVRGLFGLVAVGAMGLSVLVLARLVEVFVEDRGHLRGARLQKRFVALLLGVAVVPAMAAFVLAGTVLKTFSEEFFVERVTAANAVARDFANGYFTAESRKIGPQVVQLAADLALQARAGLDPETQPIGFRKYLLGQAILRDFTAVTILDRDLNVIVQVNRRSGQPFRLPPLRYFEDVSTPGAIPFKYDAHDKRVFDAAYALLYSPQDQFIVAYKAENAALAEQLLRVRNFRDETIGIRQRLEKLTGTFTIGFGLVMILLLLTAMWIGIMVANGIIRPVRQLATAAEAVSRGHLVRHPDLETAQGELGELGRIFNDMTEKLALQRRELLLANRQSQARRRFIETVVSGVPSGVLNVRREGTIALSNPSADAILSPEGEALTGRQLLDVAPELAPFFEETSPLAGREAQNQIEINRRGQTRIINVQVRPDDKDRPRGTLITLDDITELVAAQRNAAWGEVARRIAHEIKNPLTPIQLSAERLKRRYGDKIGEDREVFEACTDTIVRHVGDIGRMVAEFSSFARMPAPVLSECDMRETVRAAAETFAIAYPTISFRYILPDGPVPMRCDSRLMRQAIMNLVKNGVEAITEDEGSGKKKGEMIVSLEEGETNVVISITDNGRGLPQKDRARLTDPYMTTRVKGTGLGLAIVRKAVEEHSGQFSLIDRGAEDGAPGAVARIVLPKRSSYEQGDEPPTRQAV
ncbi:putative nitrogen regulation transmembrane protein [Parvularcula bermudensis HTCC2503]|uniref:histidine kinase n=1 Tax=Parvularcula bermudensis (strain ATCC BAA-594 / HTCC2503 / KCTC 12087) TaxID=314260 RepID=E0TBI3_PARBH|nr:ATP-binding protein [Parvularcula bermudensis]ADM08358.1 putative nitrogen regulation transmembrane protein [Parvularcula bermudensis HTCC2503]